MNPEELTTFYEDVPQYCEKHKKITLQIIALYKATDSGVIYFHSCNECFEEDSKKSGNEIHPWEIEKISVPNWNCLIKLR